MSGRPGISPQCSRNRYPKACSSLRTRISGCVFVFVMRRITALRFVFEIRSTLGGPLKSPLLRQVITNRFAEDFTEQRGHSVSDLAPLLFDRPREAEVIRKCLKALYLGYSKNPAAPVERPHVVGAPSLDSPRWHVRREL